MSEILDYDWKKEDANRVKAVWDGSGDAHMQRMMIKHLIEIVCGINRICLVPGNPDMTAFNSGRAWVARQLQNAITIPIDILVKEDTHEPRTNGITTATERAERAAAGNGPGRGRTAPRTR